MKTRSAAWRRRKQRQRIKSMITISLIMVSMITVFAVCGLSTNARSASDIQEYKYYTSYELEKGDTLWSIASDNYNKQYDSISSYMEEICIVNSISEDATLYAGMNLVIPYYSTEFK